MVYENGLRISESSNALRDLDTTTGVVVSTELAIGITAGLHL